MFRQSISYEYRELDQVFRLNKQTKKYNNGTNYIRVAKT